MTDLIRPDRRALLDLDAVLSKIEGLGDAGSRARYDRDDVYRWAIHRLWIAAGNEAFNYVSALGRHINQTQPWGRIYERRNRLAHQPLADIDDDAIWRVTVMRTGGYRQQTRALLN